MTASKHGSHALQRAKRALTREFGDRRWFRGVGIVPADDGLCLRLNVDPDVTVEEGEIPDTFQDIAVQIVRTKGYEPRDKLGD